MNPLFQTLMGAMPAQSQAPATVPGGPMNGILERASRIMQSVQNPQQLVSQYLPGLPAEISGDPNQIINWMQQTGRVTPQQVQMVRQMMGGQ